MNEHAPLFGRQEQGSLATAHRALEALVVNRGIDVRRVRTRAGMMRALVVPKAREAHRPPLVMVHGFASSALSLLSLAHSLDGARECVLLDLFDFAGDSRRFVSPFGTEPLRVREHASVVSESLAALDVRSYDYYGVSFGAWIGLHLAANANGDADAVTPARMFLVNPLGMRRDVERLRALETRVLARGLDEAARAFFGDGPLTRAPFGRTAMRALLSASLRVGRSRETAESLDESDAVDDFLPRIQAETFLLAGDEDALLGREGATALHRGIAHASGEFVLGVGHDLPVTCAGLVTLKLRAFVHASADATRDDALGTWARLRLHTSKKPRTKAMERTRENT